ncbi:MAG: DNA polymerase III subunit alpha [Pseudomonadota bacterium]
MCSQKSFIHLRVHSSYSLLEGAIAVKALPKLCQANHMPAIALTDTNNLFGALEFSETLSKEGIQPIIGLQIDVDLSDFFADQKSNIAPSGAVLLFAKSEAGYHNLLKIASRAYTVHSHNGGIPFTTIEDITTWQNDLILLSGGQKGTIGALLEKQKKADAEALIKTFYKAYGDRFYIELQRLGLEKEKEHEAWFLAQAYGNDIPIVATNDVMFAKKEMHAAHDALICIADGNYVVQSDRRKVSPEQYFKSPQEMQGLFHDLPEAIENTIEIAQRCAFKVSTHPPILPAFVQGGAFEDEANELRRQAHAGLKIRLDQGPLFADRKAYEERLDFELDVICKMKFPGYFLIVADFIKWSKQNDIPVGPGRGSGAGSVVAWALTITDLDPLRFGLLFERFLNPERVSMPDFDIDFCQDRREEVIQYVRDRYGHDKVAQIITFGKLQARAVIRDVGRVMQLPYGQVDRLCKLVPNNPANPMTITEALESEEPFAQAKKDDETVSNMLDIAIQLEGLYRHASTHAAGVVIGDRPLDELVPVYRDPRSEMPVTQFNMKWVEPAGMVKFDFLGLKTLTVIQKAVDLLKNRDIDIVPTHIPLDDKTTFELLGQGESTGIFQLESSGMRDVLRKMKPDSIEDIIALVALYRPGPMDNIPLYISVKKGEKEPDYLHPWLEETLKETYGVIIYQEQVMQIAQILSGYSLGEADLLRRAMGKKIKEEMDKQRERFVGGATEKNVDAQQAGFIFDLVAKFAGYGFNKSHAAAYAFVSYQTAYLKANYPTEFMAATMTYDMSNTDKLVIDIQEIKRLKIPLISPSVNTSGVDFTVKDGKIFYALAAIKNVGEAAMVSLVQEREQNGPFKDIYDFARRLDSGVMNKRTLEFLIKSGALDCFSSNRKQLLSSLDILVAESVRAHQEKTGGQNSLFGAEAEENMRVPLAQVPDDPMMERLSQEHNALGFYLSAHPLDNIKSVLKSAHVMSYSTLISKAENSPVTGKIAGTISRKQERKSAKGNRFAFVGLSDASGNYEVALFSDVLEQSRDLLEVGTSVVLNVEAKMEGDQIRVRVQSLRPIEDLAPQEDMNLCLKVTSPVAIEGVKKILRDKGKANAGNGKIILKIDDAHIGKSASIMLNQRYRVTPALQTRLLDIAGIESAEEV